MEENITDKSLRENIKLPEFLLQQAIPHDLN
jgi:hypothetical protein